MSNNIIYWNNQRLTLLTIIYSSQNHQIYKLSLDELIHLIINIFLMCNYAYTYTKPHTPTGRHPWLSGTRPGRMVEWHPRRVTRSNFCVKMINYHFYRGNWDDCGRRWLPSRWWKDLAVAHFGSRGSFSWGGIMLLIQALVWLHVS